MKRFVSIVLSCSLICSNVLAVDTNAIEDDVSETITETLETKNTNDETVAEEVTDENTANKTEETVDAKNETKDADDITYAKKPSATKENKTISAPLKWGLVAGGSVIGGSWLLSGIAGLAIWGATQNRGNHLHSSYYSTPTNYCNSCAAVKYKICTMDPNYQLPAGENDLPD
ncbi:MAG: hypothetical protein IKE05_02555, partial [Clostridia bacterium]|nr:hypothetical protein [Clostridia bacterium]